jgi:hypothetical protein
MFSPTLSSGHIFVADPFLRERFLSAMLELYVQVEHGEQQFYTKFQTRHAINEILEFLWNEPHYQNQLKALSQTKEWDGFANVLVNETMHLLNESLGKF